MKYLGERHWNMKPEMKRRRRRRRKRSCMSLKNNKSSLN
jgi:hypothetical protein